MPRRPASTPITATPITAQSSNILRLGLPVTAVAGIAWFVASLFYGAGQKVTASESSIQSLELQLKASEKTLEGKIDDCEQARRELKTTVENDHDTITSLKSQIAGLEHNIDVLQRDQNNMPIQLNVKDEAKK